MNTLLYGAIIGDISGSCYEGDNRTIKTKDFKFIRRSGHITDDTVMTIAIADALLEPYGGLNEGSIKSAVIESLQSWGRKYPKAGYGRKFTNWFMSDNPQPYGSFGNGAAMRVSAVDLIGIIYGDLDLVRNVARWTAEVTHNHPEGVKSAEAVASAIFLARNKVSKSEIKSYVEKNFGYDLSRTLNEIRPNYHHETSAQKSVPEAIISFLEADNFEDAIRNAVSLGGDSDTLAAIAGSIAEAFFGVPKEFIDKAREKIPQEMLKVIDEVNLIINLQSKCPELHGNEQIDLAIRRFSARQSNDVSEILNAIHDRIQADGCFIVALDNTSPIYTSPIFESDFGANHDFKLVFTNFYEFNKKVRRNRGGIKYVTNRIDNLLENCAKVNARMHEPYDDPKMGLIINDCSDRFELPADLIDLLVKVPFDSFNVEKSLDYRDLVKRAKNQYPEYRASLATGNKVELFAPVVNGVNICNEINLYTYWQGFGYAGRTPKIKYLLVAQDWGNFFNDDAEPFKAAIEKMNAGEDVPYPFSMKSTTDKNLIELFKILGRDITKPCADVFFTNFCLGYRFGNEGSGMTKKLMMHDAELFRELCEILEPENILCLGKITSEAVYEALTGEPSKNIYGNANTYSELLDAKKCILVTCNEKTSQIYPLAHCGGMGTANRSLDKQKQDWKKILKDDIFRDALYVVHTNQSGWTTDYFLDSNGKAHNVLDDKKVAKFYDRLPYFSQPRGSDWTFFYQGMGNGYFVNNKVVDAYLAKSGIKGFGAEQLFEEAAALETIAELHS